MFPSVVPVGFSVRPDQPSDMLPRCPTMKQRSPKPSLILLVSLAVTAIAGLQPCCALKAGM